MRRFASAATAACFASCVPSMTVTPSGRDLQLAPRPEDCAIEFFRTKVPERAYDEVATLAYGGGLSDASMAHEDLRKQACALGADAVIVTRDYALGEMSGIAVSFRDARVVHRLELLGAVAKAIQAQQKWAEAAKAEARATGSRPPAGYMPAKVRVHTKPRAAPSRMGPEKELLDAGTVVWAGPEVADGFRRLWARGAFLGYVPSDELVLDQVPQGPAPQPLERTDI